MFSTEPAMPVIILLQVKQNLKSSIKRFANELPHELPHDLRLEKLRNWVMAFNTVSRNTPFQKQKFGNSRKKAYIQGLWIAPILLCFLTF